MTKIPEKYKTETKQMTKHNNEWIRNYHYSCKEGDQHQQQHQQQQQKHQKNLQQK
jgi:hypothetical protein